MANKQSLVLRAKNPVVHFEMPAKNRERVKKFYEEAFSWKVNLMGEDFGNYAIAQTTETDENNMVKTSGTINGGFFEYDEKNPGRNIPSVVISVDNMDEALEKVKRAGGKIEGEPQEIPTIGMWVVFIDSEGNRVSMIEPPTGK
jgi:uncharacterized protein